MNYQNLICSLDNRVRTITINRPQKLNALNKETINDLHEVLKSEKSNRKTKVIIITGSGGKAFVAGADISEFSTFDIRRGADLAAKGQEKLFDYIENYNKPIIAAINGYALGGGLELAMACHLRVASTNAKMGLPEVSLGLIPGYGGTQRLPQLIGKGRAMEMIFTAGMINAEQALNYGLINHLKAPEELLPFCLQLAKSMKKNSPAAIARAIRSINAGFKTGVNGYDIEIESFGDCFGTEDFKEGTQAFLEKRKAEFKGV